MDDNNIIRWNRNLQSTLLDYRNHSEAGVELAMYLGRAKSRINLAYIFPESEELAVPMERRPFHEAMRDIFLSYGLKNGNGTYGFMDLNTNRASHYMLKVGTHRIIHEDVESGTVKRGNSKQPTFKNKVIPELERLGYIASATVSYYHDRKGKPTMSYMVFPWMGSIVK